MAGVFVKVLVYYHLGRAITGWGFVGVIPVVAISEAGPHLGSIVNTDYYYAAAQATNQVQADDIVVDIIQQVRIAVTVTEDSVNTAVTSAVIFANDPDEYPKLLQPILDGKADVVYGSRFRGGASHRGLFFWHSVGNRFLTLLSNMMTDLNLTDMETCYKVFRREIIQAVDIQEDRFGFEPEITAKVARMGCRIYEVGISYSGRTYEEGKKIGWKDGMHAIWCILKYNLGTRKKPKPPSPQ